METQPKKIYSEPVVVDYGELAEVTQAGGSGGGDLANSFSQA